MKKSRLIGVVCAILFSFISVSANAALVSRLGGAAAYDTVLDITWLTDASPIGGGNWDLQVAWADSLDTLGFDDWRLASMSVSAGVPTGTTDSVVDCSAVSELLCRDNELGYMFYQNMDGDLFDDKRGNQTVDGVLLTDVQSGYWSGTEFAPNPALAWLFNFVVGFQLNGVKDDGYYGWAVRAGDVSAVPVPAAVWLFGSGLIGLLGLARRKKS